MALSPMMRYYLEVKEKYKDAILMFRLGDFYEMFFEDAKLCSEVLDLTLTGRDCGLEQRAPMCGVPYHAVDGYISKLINAGYKVAICEQLSAPQARGLVERDVVRVITPGTVIEDDILDDKKNNYLACLVMSEKEYSLAWVDVSTGEFNVMQSEYGDFSAIEDMLTTIAPAEIIANGYAADKVRDLPEMRKSRFAPVQRYHDYIFTESNASAAIKKQFGVQNLQKYEFGDQKLCYQSVGALCLYLEETQKRALTHIKDVRLVRSNRYMVLDANARRNLELTANLRDGSRRGTLLKVLDRTRTSMGARNLRRWLEQPLRDSKEINRRLDAVGALVNGARVRSNLDELLSLVKDLERLASKIVYGNPSPRDFIAIAQSLAPMPQIKEMLSGIADPCLSGLCERIFTLADERARILDVIDENPPAVTKDGGFVRKGYSEELDACRSAKTDGKNWLAKLESDERAQTGIKTLKVGYNKVFGYYIEVSKGALDKVPIRYVRKQTLTTGERFITEELKQIEDKIVNSESRAIEIELALYEQLKLEMLQVIPQLQSTARSIAALDTLLSFAKLANDCDYCRPEIDDNTEVIEIVGGRHPVVESLLPSGAFVPNDTELDCGQNRTMVITGPNMAGKSTYMRQVALITLMAHIGCFVPATSAKIAVTDRIFTRIGASDDVAYGQSTFMVEMVEVATILQNATMRSLLILDEIGRGTSTFDGLAIAKAVLEAVTDKIRCKTLFSTHYHELTSLESKMEGVKNYKIVASERESGIVFLHKIMRGGTNKSFGIEVAKLAGVPKDVIARAKRISSELEKDAISRVNEKAAAKQPDLIAMMSANEILDALRGCNVDEMAPIQAWMFLGDLVKKAREDN